MRFALGAAVARRELMSSGGITLDQLDVIALNEAFAAGRSQRCARSTSIRSMTRA
jgi:acetyl-CoA acetyltransferase